MGGKTIVLLFEKNRNNEPAAIISDDISGEYFPWSFTVWKDAVHFLNYYYLHFINKYEKTIKKNGKYYDINDAYNKWCENYGYNEEEKFLGDLNEFSDKEWYISTSIGGMDNYASDPIDLYKISAWTYKSPKRDYGSGSEGADEDSDEDMDEITDKMREVSIPKKRKL